MASTGNPDAQSDALATIASGTVGNKIRIAQLSIQGNPTILRHLYWSTDGEKDGFSIIGFAGEFKKDDNECNENQLIMVLTTAQAQRKALSLKPSIIMGATACVAACKSSLRTGQMTTQYVHSYVSVAKNSDFHSSFASMSTSNSLISPDPVQMIRLYVFCSKLEKHFQSTLALELNTWNPPTDMATLQSRMWRSPDYTRKRRRTEAGENVNGSSGGIEGGNYGPVEADGFDDNWCMNIMKWRDEVVKDGKEGRVISDEDNIPQAGYNLKGELSLLCHKPTF